MGNARNIAFWVILFLLILALFNLFSGGSVTSSDRSVSYSEFMTRVEAGQVSAVTLDGERVLVTGADGSRYATISPKDDTLTARLLAKNVEVRAEPQQSSGFMSLISL